MSLHPQSIGPVPEDTARVTRAAFPRGNPYLRLRNELGTIFSDEDFASLFPTRGQPGEALWRLILVSLLQYAENLSDRQAADAVRSRIDGKYLLGLELTDAGFEPGISLSSRNRSSVGRMCPPQDTKQLTSDIDFEQSESRALGLPAF